MVLRVSKKCLIHIGVHKTGSTSFQLSLSRVRQQLSDVGVLYPAQPDLLFDKFVAHHRIAATLTGQDFSSEAVEYGPSLSELESAIRETEHDQLILSSESFSMPFSQNAEESPLVRMLLREGYKITVVALVRPQVELLQAAYVEGVTSFFNYISFAEYLEMAIHDPFFDYPKRLRPWTESGHLTFVAIPYNRKVRSQNLSEIILSAGGISVGSDLIERLKPEHINQNPGALTIAAIRWFVPHLSELQFDPLRDELKAFILADARRLGWDQEPFHGHTAQTVRQIRGEFKKSNAKFALSSWGRKWSELFARERRKLECNEINLELADPELRRKFNAFRLRVQAHHARLKSGAAHSR